MNYISTFFSYSTRDEHLVKTVADELCQLGVLVWLDKNELEPGVNLTPILNQAIREQSSVTIFVSKPALESAWVNQELNTIIDLEKSIENQERIIPVFLGDPLELVNSHPLLKNDWLHADGDRVDRNGIIPDPRKSISEQAEDIAQKIASRLYSISKISDQKEVIIYIDQRGDRKRRGKPVDIPENVRRIDAPALVFRPNHNMATRGEVIQGKEWEKLRDNFSNALNIALNGVRWNSYKQIRILGNAQLSIPFILGQIFDRNTPAHLYCYGRNEIFSNAKQPRNSPLSGGNPNCDLIDSKLGLNPIPENQSLKKIALLLSKENFLKDVQDYLKNNPDPPHLVMVKSGDFNNNDQVMSYIADVVALLLRLRKENNVRAIDLYCSLPFHVIPIFAANLLHVIDNVTFMEFDRSKDKIEEKYIQLGTIAKK